MYSIRDYSYQMDYKGDKSHDVDDEEEGPSPAEFKGSESKTAESKEKEEGLNPSEILEKVQEYFYGNE